MILIWAERPGGSGNIQRGRKDDVALDGGRGSLHLLHERGVAHDLAGVPNSRQVSSRRTIARTMDPSSTSVSSQMSLKGIPLAQW